MTVTITPTKLKGTITPPPTKSQAHRLLIAAALAQGESVIHNVVLSKDIVATMNCLEELGASFSRKGSTVTVTGMVYVPALLHSDRSTLTTISSVVSAARSVCAPLTVTSSGPASDTSSPPERFRNRICWL